MLLMKFLFLNFEEVDQLLGISTETSLFLRYACEVLIFCSSWVEKFSKFLICEVLINQNVKIHALFYHFLLERV